MYEITNSFVYYPYVLVEDVCSWTAAYKTCTACCTGLYNTVFSYIKINDFSHEVFHLHQPTHIATWLKTEETPEAE